MRRFFEIGRGLARPSEYDLGPDAVRNEALDALQPGEVLLVQMLSAPDAEPSVPLVQD